MKPQKQLSRKVKKVICLLKGIKYSFPGIIFGDFWVSGHAFVEIEKTPEKQILKCDVCGEEDIGYYL